MHLVGYLALLSAALCCTAAPANEGATCPHPGMIENAALDGDWNAQTYPAGTDAIYSCRPGFSRLGSLKKTCKDGRWAFLGSPGRCKKRSCGHPGDIPFGTFELITEVEFVFGAVVKYTCDDGYQMVSRQNTRQCTASGWSNFPPHCEVRNCPPVMVENNVKVLSTSYDEEYSVGQVVRFECKNPRLKLEGPSEIFCESEGKWNSKPPVCVEIRCNPPIIVNGNVKTSIETFNEDDKIQFECNKGFKATRTKEATCTKDGWIPAPGCEEITCSAHQYVENGLLEIGKSVFKDGETTTLKCDDSYKSQYKADQRYTCTTNGWDPPPVCISIKCDEPELKNGYLYYNYNFPMRTGNNLEYRCYEYFVSHQRKYWGRSLCTIKGWDPEPKCFTKCDFREADVANGKINHLVYIYLEGEEVQFTCSKGFKTADGKSNGYRTCLSNGKFSPAKCSRTCSIVSHEHTTYEPNKDEFETGEYVQYKCDVGFKSHNGNLKDSLQCLNDGWPVKPQCIPITCKWDNKEYSNEDKIKYTCPDGKRPSSPLTQCFYYGWGPPTDCEAITCTVPEKLNLIKSPHSETYNNGKKVSFSCEGDLEIVGPKWSVCTVNDWDPPLPYCQDQNLPQTTLSPNNTETSIAPTDISPDKRGLECAPAYSPKNAKIKDPKEKYYSDDEVHFKCNIGYTLYGPSSVKCNKGIWESPPQCIELKKCKTPPTVKNGEQTGPFARNYSTDSIVKYTCSPGFHFTGSDQVTCIDGQWTALPVCTENSCGKAPPVKDGFVTEKKTNFQHGERAIYQCNPGFTLSRGTAAECIEGQWKKTPDCVSTSCKSPPNGKNSTPINPKTVYKSGEKVTYKCTQGHSLEQPTNEAVCNNTEWKEIPSCRKTGSSCGPPPVVQYGDTIDIRKAEYRTGESVQFKCPEYYVLQGKARITCNNGKWEDAPVCLEPCTVKENEMQKNNIRLAYLDDKKLYSKHDDTTQFSCLSGYETLPGTIMRQKCNRGEIQYPKCYRSGFCVLETPEMIRRNIHYNRSTIVENRETISFECINGFTPEENLKSTCNKEQINYPRCVTSRSCSAPRIQNGKIKTEDRTSFDSGSSVEFVCDLNFFLEGKINVRCENGQWHDLPQCLKPCKILADDLDKNNVVLKSNDHQDKIYLHGTDVDISCKPKSKRQNQASLKGVCYNGNMVYQRCFFGEICRLNQENIDDKNLELHESHYNEIFYEVGEQIRFKCKEGFRNFSGLTTSCSATGITYPSCISQSEV